MKGIFNRRYNGMRRVKRIMEMKNVSYVDRPHAILKFIRNGFNVTDISIIRIDASHYDMVAAKQWSITQ